MPKNKVTVCFVLPDLNRGGAQRIMSYIASNIDRSIFEPTLVIISTPVETDFKISNVKVIYLNKKRLLNASLSLFLTLSTRKFDIVIGSIGHINKILGYYSLLIRKTKFIGREASINNVIQKYNTSKEPIIARYFHDYRKKLDAIICQSKDMTEDAIKAFDLDENKVFTINNPLTFIPNDISPIDPSSNSRKNLITIGRLSKEKGHNRIIENLSKIELDWHYTILGEGIEKENIIHQINALNLQHRITLKPYIDDVKSILPDFDLFLQGSFVEGFPNATLESCALGTPVVAFKAPGGTSEIIENGINGFIAHDKNEFKEYILESLIRKKWNRKLVSNSVVEKFNPNIILLKYQNLFLNILSK